MCFFNELVPFYIYYKINIIMEYKKCTKCEVVKEISNFWRRKNSYRSSCKDCAKEYDREYQKTDKRKEYLEKSKTDEKRIEYKKNYMKEYQKTDKRKEYLEKSKTDGKRIEYKKNYRKEYESSEKRKEYKNTEKYKEYKRKYNRKYIKNRKEIDSLFKLSISIRNRIRESIYQLGFSKHSKTRDILGCEVHEFKIHLESLFTDGMSWENYGKDMSGWQLDHIIPISIAKNYDELIHLNHYKNFQPLWAIDNIKKSNKIFQTENGYDYLSYFRPIGA